jgi:hypothetical protein
MNFEVGDVVKWNWTELHQSTYIIVEIKNDKALLKQNFGIGITLNGYISLSELSK